MNQRIVCAANRHKFVGDIDIILGIRHWDELVRQQVSDSDYSDYEQGFIDNKGKFLTREGQIIRRIGGDEDCLYSENLY